jgi:hypothetical protein
MRVLVGSFSVTCLLVGIILTIINICGITQDLRPSNITPENLRFGSIDVSLSKEELLQNSKMLPKESPVEYSKRLTSVIANGIAHIHWGRYEPSLFHQTVPIWENWVLHAMGLFSGIPEYQRYHYSNPEKSMERGIGICGDAAMIMSQVLEKSGIESKIVTFPGHVVVAATIQNQSFIFDPDYGVVIESSLEALNENPQRVDGLYSAVGHPAQEDAFFIKTYGEDYQVWNGVNHFITKKYYFENFAYLIKWPAPLIIIAIGIWIIFRNTAFKNKL